MTTTVKVLAHAGWPVDVTPIDTKTGLPAGTKMRCPAGEEATYYVHSGQDLRVHEVQPDAEPMQAEAVGPVDRMMQFFAFEHLPAHLQAISRPFGLLALNIVETLPSNPERTVALRKLLEAKDCAVRAYLYK